VYLTSRLTFSLVVIGANTSVPVGDTSMRILVPA
jgi:hypothetical protein